MCVPLPFRHGLVKMWGWHRLRASAWPASALLSPADWKCTGVYSLTSRAELDRSVAHGRLQSACAYAPGCGRCGKRFDLHLERFLCTFAEPRPPALASRIGAVSGDVHTIVVQTAAAGRLESIRVTGDIDRRAVGPALEHHSSSSSNPSRQPDHRIAVP